MYEPFLFKAKGFISSELVVCLDVLYHIIDDDEYRKTLNDIFSVSSRFVILYTSLNAYKNEPYSGAHVKHRDTMRDLVAHPDFKVVKVIPNAYPEKSSAVFVLLEKRGYKALEGQL